MPPKRPVPEDIAERLRFHKERRDFHTAAIRRLVRAAIKRGSSKTQVAEVLGTDNAHKIDTLLHPKREI